MPTQNVNLTDKIANFVHQQVENGSFKNASEVHRAALVEMERREEERNAVVSWLRREAQIGIDEIEAGKCSTFNGIDELDNWMSNALSQVLEHSHSESDAEPV